MKLFCTFLFFALYSFCYSQFGYYPLSDQSIDDKRNYQDNIQHLATLMELRESPITIQPRKVHKFINYLSIDDLDQAWEMVDDKVKLDQGKEQFIAQIQLYNKYLGKVIKYKEKSFNTYKDVAENSFAIVKYKIDFGDFKGYAEGLFRVQNLSTAKALSFNFTFKDYTFPDTLNRIPEPAVEAIKDKNTTKLYSLTSDGLKEKIKYPEFEHQFEEILNVGFTSLLLYKSFFWVKNNIEYLTLQYELNNNLGYLFLSFSSLDKESKLESVTYVPGE